MLIDIYIYIYSLPCKHLNIDSKNYYTMYTYSLQINIRNL
jgi:hypothetical protein